LEEEEEKGGQGGNIPHRNIKEHLGTSTTTTTKRKLTLQNDTGQAKKVGADS